MKNNQILKIKPGNVVQTKEDGIIIIDEDGLLFESSGNYYYFYDIDGNYYNENDFIEIVSHYPFVSNRKNIVDLLVDFETYMIHNETPIETNLGKVSSYYGYDIIEIKKLDEDFYIITAAMKERSILNKDEIKMGDYAIFYMQNEKIYTYNEWQDKCKEVENEYE